MTSLNFSCVKFLLELYNDYALELLKAGRTMAAINKATPPTIAAPLEELVFVALEAANAPTEEITITTKVATDLIKLFIFYCLIVLDYFTF